LPLALSLGAAASALGSGEPQESVLYQNFVRASEVLDRAVAAHGSEALIDRTRDLRLSFTGTLLYEGHYARPWAHKDYRLDGTLLYSTDLASLKSEMKAEGERSYSSFTLVGPSNGLKLDLGSSRPDSIPEKELAKALSEELEILPHEYLRQARTHAASLRLLPETEGHHVLAYSLDDGESRALLLDAGTHLLMRVERIGHWELKGDRLEWRTFADYFDQDGVKVPRRSEVHTEDFASQFDLRTEITQVEFGAVGNDELSVPEPHRAKLEAWALQPRKP
jgi:hypothetical protein